jgi:CRP/FNR family transcriptional regulator
MANATQYHVSAGSTIRREGDNAAHFDLVVTGLLRVYVTALDGRTLTVRYCRPGSIMGTVSLFVDPFSMPASIQAITDALVLAFPPTSVKRAAERDERVALALFNELSQRVLSFVAEIPGSAFATVRQRMARNLLDLATAEQKGPELIATISQQELADAVGSVREVVVRVLRQLRQEHMIETGRRGIKLLDPERLAAEVYPAPGTFVPIGWDRSP